MNEGVKNAISWWNLKGKRTTAREPFTKFFIYYICLDAWLTTESGEDIFEKKLNWFLHNDNCLKKTLDGFWNIATRQYLNSLKNSSPIEDMRPKHRGEFVYLNDVNNLGEVLKFIYQIRCNFFHGSNNPMDSRHSNLVSVAGSFLEDWIKYACVGCF